VETYTDQSAMLYFINVAKEISGMN